MRRAPFALLSMAAALAGGCGTDFDLGHEIKTTRVLGARVEASADPTRAWPRPGESARLEWLVVDPREPAPLGWAFFGCVPTDVRSGMASCAGGATAPVAGTTRPPIVELPIPERAALGDARTLLVVGIVCANGTPAFDPATMQPRCAGADADATAVTLSVPLDVDGTGNRNPELADDAWSLGDTPWPAPADLQTIALEGCAEGAADPSVPRVGAGAGTQIVRLALADADRETYEVAVGSPPVLRAIRETLTISSFADGGTLDRQFSVVEGTDATTAPAIEVEWDPPAATDVSARGTLVRLHFVVRDGRGGLAFGSRALCATR